MVSCWVGTTIAIPLARPQGIEESRPDASPGFKENEILPGHCGSVVDPVACQRVRTDMAATCGLHLHAANPHLEGSKMWGAPFYRTRLVGCGPMGKDCFWTAFLSSLVQVAFFRNRLTLMA